MPHVDAILNEHGHTFGFRTAPMLPDSKRVWAPGRAVARAGSPASDAADDAAVWKVRVGSRVADLDAAIERALATIPADSSLCLWPDAESVLSDVPTCLSLLRRFEGRVELLLAPADFLVPSMARHAGDHLLRILGSFAGHPAIRGVVLEDVHFDLHVDGDILTKRPAGEGSIPEGAWRAAMALVAGAAWSIVVDQCDRSAWLRGL